MSFDDLEAGRGLPRRRDPANGSDSSQALANGVFQITTAVSSFQRLVNTLGTPKDTPQLREKLHKTRQQIGQLVKDTSAKLKAASEKDRGDVSASKKVADAKLARDFQSVLKEFQKAQRLAAERETTYTPLIPQAALSSSYTTGESNTGPDRFQEQQQALLQESRRDILLTCLDLWAGVPKCPAVRERCRSFMLKREFSVLLENYLCCRDLEQLFCSQASGQEVFQLENEVVFNEAIIEEREQGIQEIQQQIGEVHEIFKDLAVLVHEQGVMIDDIDSNMQNAYSATTVAKQELAKASKSQKSNSSLTCLLLVIFGIILLIVIIVLVA